MLNVHIPLMVRHGWLVVIAAGATTLAASLAILGGVAGMSLPRAGAGGTKNAFVHPKAAHGVLVELCESHD